MFLFMGPLHSLRDNIIRWKKIEFDSSKKVSIFAQSLISHYFRGPYDCCSWWAPARGCPHFLNFWKSLKNEASGSKNKNFASSTFEECPICYNCSFMIENKGFMLGSWWNNFLENMKKYSIFSQSLVSYYFRGPYVGCSWWAPARGCPHFSNFRESPKNEASRSKKLKFNETKDFWKSCLLGPP